MARNQGVRRGAELELGKGGAVPGYVSELGTRISSIIDLYPTKAEAASVAEVTTESLGHYVSGKAKPRFDALARLASRKGVSLDWLARGEGPMKRQETAVPNELGDDYVLVKRFDVRSAAGAGAVGEAAEVMAPLAFRREWIRNRLRRNPETLVVIENGGDSMFPTISDGDILLIDTAESQIRTQGIYSLMIDGLLVTKRCQISGKGKLVLTSDNPSYGPAEMHPADIEDLRVLGRVVWHGGMI